MGKEPGPGKGEEPGGRGGPGKPGCLVLVHEEVCIELGLGAVDGVDRQICRGVTGGLDDEGEGLGV